MVVEDFGLRRDDVHVRRRLVEVLRASEKDVGGQEPLRVETGEVALLVEEPAQHEPRPNEEHH